MSDEEKSELEEDEEDNDSLSRRGRVASTYCPKTWEEVADEEENYKPEKEPERITFETDDSDLVLDETQDPLGFGRFADLLAAAVDEDEPMPKGALRNLPSRDNFDAARYVREVHKKSTYRELAQGLRKLRSEVSDQTKQLKLLVKDNFNRFVSCREYLDIIHQRLVENEADPTAASTLKVLNALAEVDSKATRVFGPRLERKRSADAIRTVLNAIQRFQFLFTLPAAIRSHLQKDEFDAIVRDYKRAKTLLCATPAAPILLGVQAQVVSLIADARRRLLDLLELPALDDFERIITYLNELDATEDPAWHFVLAQHRHMCNYLCSLLRSYSPLPSALASSIARTASAQYGSLADVVRNALMAKAGPPSMSASSSLQSLPSGLQPTPSGMLSQAASTMSKVRGALLHAMKNTNSEEVLSSVQVFAEKLSLAFELVMGRFWTIVRHLYPAPRHHSGDSVRALVLSAMNVYTVGLLTILTGVKLLPEHIASLLPEHTSLPSPSSPPVNPSTLTPATSPTESKPLPPLPMPIAKPLALILLDDRLDSDALPDPWNPSQNKKAASKKMGATTSCASSALPEDHLRAALQARMAGNSPWTLSRRIVSCVQRCHYRLADEVPASFVEIVKRFDECVTRRFVRHLWIATSQKVSALHAEEDWQYGADNGTSRTTLPARLHYLISTALTQCDTLVLPHTPLHSFLEASFFTSVHRFADALHALLPCPSRSKPSPDPSPAATAPQSASPAGARALDRACLEASTAESVVWGVGDASAHRASLGSLSGTRLSFRSTSLSSRHLSAPRQLPSLPTDVRQLVAASNLEHVRTSVLPSLWNMYCLWFDNNPASPAHTQHYAEAVEVLEQARGLALSHFTRSKTLFINATVRHALLFSGFDWAAEFEVNDVREYWHEVVMELVLVHSQLYALASFAAKPVLRSLMSAVAVCYADSLSQVSSPSEAALQQVALELEALDRGFNDVTDDSLRSCFLCAYDALDALVRLRQTPLSPLKQDASSLSRTASNSSTQYGSLSDVVRNAWLSKAPSAAPSTVASPTALRHQASASLTKMRGAIQQVLKKTKSVQSRRPSDTYPQLRDVLRDVLQRTRVHFECLS